MRKRDIERMLRKDLLPHLPGFAVFGTALVKMPVGLVMCNVSFDRSGWDPLSFSHIYASAMPLWIPFPAWWYPPGSIDLTMSDEHDDTPPPPKNPHYSRWGHVAEIKRRAIPLLAKLGTAKGLYQNLREHSRREDERGTSTSGTR